MGIKNPHMFNYDVPGGIVHEEGIQEYVGKKEGLENNHDRQILEYMEQLIEEHESSGE